MDAVAESVLGHRRAATVLLRSGDAGVGGVNAVRRTEYSDLGQQPRIDVNQRACPHRCGGRCPLQRLVSHLRGEIGDQAGARRQVRVPLRVWGWSSAVWEPPGPPRLIRPIRRPRQGVRNRPPSLRRRRRSPADPQGAAVRRDQRRPPESLLRFRRPLQLALAAVTVRSSSRRRDTPHHRSVALGLTTRPASACPCRRLQPCSLLPASGSSYQGAQELTPLPNRRLLLRRRLRLAR